MAKLNTSAVRERMSELNCRAVEMNPPRLEMGLTELNRSVGEMSELTELNCSVGEMITKMNSYLGMNQDAVQRGCRWAKLSLVTRKLRETGAGRLTELNTRADTPPSPAAVITKQLDSATL